MAENYTYIATAYSCLVCEQCNKEDVCAATQGNCPEGTAHLWLASEETLLWAGCVASCSLRPGALVTLNWDPCWALCSWSQLPPGPLTVKSSSRIDLWKTSLAESWNNVCCYHSKHIVLSPCLCFMLGLVFVCLEKTMDDRITQNM